MAQDDLLTVAEHLICEGREKQAYLRRAVSSVYYALFHCLAHCCADSLIGEDAADRSEEAWLHVYRSLEHRFPVRQFEKQSFKAFPEPIQQFGQLFKKMQIKRHRADYDPAEEFTPIAVQLDIDQARKTLAAFRSVDPKDRRAFAAFVLLKLRD